MNDNEEKKTAEDTKFSQNSQPVFKNEGSQTVSGLSENVGGMLCYIVIIGIIFLFIEKENRFIRFHALQAVFTAIAVLLISILLNIIPVIGWLLSILLTPLIFVLLIFMMYQAYQGKYFKLPFVGDMAEEQLK